MYSRAPGGTPAGQLSWDGTPPGCEARQTCSGMANLGRNGSRAGIDGKGGAVGEGVRREEPERRREKRKNLGGD
jgi:hypothetical protein